MQIRRLRITRFRRFESFEWCPGPGLNCLVGPGDTGKTTALSAIAQLLSPNPAPAVTEFDYFKRRTAEGFEVEAVVAGIDPEALRAFRAPVAQGWLGGNLVPLPDEGDAEAVHVLRATASAEFELSLHVVPPSGDPVVLPVRARQRVGYARIAPSEWAARELRLGRATLLEKHVGGDEVRAALQAAIASASSSLDFSGTTEERLEELRVLFRSQGLPADLMLGLIAPQGSSLMALVGLLEGAAPEVAIPLLFAGTGTRNLALFSLSASLANSAPLLLFDEPEAGLEPYRQRALVGRLRELVGVEGQVFMTTHSPAILEALEPNEVWRLGTDGGPLRLDGAAERLLRKAPDALLARMPVLCEGDTEVGLVGTLLQPRDSSPGAASLDALGVRLVDGGGQPLVLREAQALLDAGMTIGTFVDAEHDHRGKRDALAQESACAFASWDDTGYRNIEEALAMTLSLELLDELVALAAEEQRVSVESCRQQVGERVGRAGTATVTELVAATDEQKCRKALAAAMGERGWFKTEDRGAALGTFLLNRGCPDVVSQLIDTLSAGIQTRLS